MNKKILIVLIVFFIIICTLIMVNNSKSQEEKGKENLNNLEIMQDENSKMYYITDENGEIIHEAEDKESLYIYTIDPEYDPKIPE